MDAQRTRMLTYRVDDPVGLGQGLFIAESENGPAEAFQLYLAQVISEYDVIPLMDTAVDLQASRCTLQPARGLVSTGVRIQRETTHLLSP